MPKKLSAGLLTIGALVLGCAFLLPYIASRISSALAECDRKTMSENVAPGGEYVLREVEVNCGATIDFSTDLELLHQPYGMSHVVFTVYHRGQHLKDIKIAWKDEFHLDITYLGSTVDVFRAEALWRDVRVNYLFEENSKNFGQPGVIK